MEAEDSMQPAGEQARPTIVISGSLAYDYIMSYPGSFQDHIIPGKVYVLSISFLLDSLRRHRGGVAGNIAVAWVLTLPAAAIIGGLVYAFSSIFGSGALGPVVVSLSILGVVLAFLGRRVTRGQVLTADA